MKRITFEGNFCEICQCIGEPGNTSECESGYCDQRRTWERLKEYEDKIERGELVEVVHGEWIHHYYDSGKPIDDKWYCSECHMCNDHKRTWYCPNCGAKMDGKRRTDGETERT